MKMKMTMAVMALAVSAMSGSAFAASEQTKSTSTLATTVTVKADEAGVQFIPLQTDVSLEQLAKEKGISVEELIKQLEKEGKLTKATKTWEPAIKK